MLHDGYEISRCENIGSWIGFSPFSFCFFFQFCDVGGLCNLIKSWWIHVFVTGIKFWTQIESAKEAISII